MSGKELRIVFMGTPGFAVETLKALVEAEYNIVGVITAPDKPAGRGQKIQESDVKKYAVEKGLKILQPEKLKTPEFIEELQELKSDLQIVVAFRMLPEVVWQMPKLGTFNLHASLLPQYRGAAPINWAVINGETTTGVTTFLIDKEIDTGKILLQKEIDILETDSAGSLHDRMMVVGAELVKETVDLLATGDFNAKPQEALFETSKELKPAQKIFKDDCRIDWTGEIKQIYNFIRGLSPFPGAWTNLVNQETGKKFNLKVFETEYEVKTHHETIGSLKTDKNSIFVAVKGGFLSLKVLQLEGKKRLKAEELLRGYSFDNQKLE
ncbi:MAG: methionyl-tRNA formyltransferase [Chloroflexia bacterium]|nr:methionyl-tRNA formyltransferase [Chloroflexia bacterium]